jgi:hypothetical protein
MRTRALFAIALWATACDSVADPIALDEPILAHEANFKRGVLPGSAPEGGAEPRITSLALGFGVLRPGAQNAQISGRVAGSAYSIGARLAGQGSGYWVRSVGAEDPLLPGELQWQLSFDAAVEIEPGKHLLEVVAFDGQGNAGSKASLPVCVASDLPDNLNVCNPTTPPPAYIASLHWNGDSDLDLTAIAPDGTAYGRSKRSLRAADKVVVRFDGDGVSGCLADGRRRESIALDDGAPAGSWKFYANLFDSCGAASTTFELTLYRRVQNPDGTFGLVEERTTHGPFIRAQANGGAGTPLFVTELSL